MSEKAEKCPVCFSTINKFAMGEKNDYKLIACQACGSVMTDPVLTQTELDTFFGDIQPEIVHISNYEKLIEDLKKTLKNIVPNPAGKRFLDISCRQGYALAAAKEYGFKKIKGIDPHEFFISFAKAKYNPDTFEHISVQDYAAAENMEQADVVFSIESFCEQPDLESYMAALAKIVARGGLLYINEPDGNSIFLPRNFLKWVFADPPINFIYLSKAGMIKLLARHGFKVQKNFFVWRPFMRLVAVKV